MSRIFSDHYLHPIPISKYLKIDKVAAGFAHTIMVSKDNKIFCLG